MMAEPMVPGRGLPVYQPATVVEDGTCNAPPAVRPSVISWVFTPIGGIVSQTGLATGTGLATETGCADWGFSPSSSSRWIGTASGAPSSTIR